MGQSTVLQHEPWLDGCESNTYSQFGEDGLIAAILDRIGAATQTCFEIGAFDGHTFSNVAKLIDEGWHAVLIERDVQAFELCKDRYQDNPRVRTVHKHVLPWELDAVLSEAGIADEIDLASIDIDEQDFWLWAGMQRYQPRIAIVEYGMHRPSNQIPPLCATKKNPDPSVQAGRNMIYYLGRAKGYHAVAATACNMLFLRADLMEQLEHEHG